jgi:hypothetical protein
MVRYVFLGVHAVYILLYDIPTQIYKQPNKPCKRLNRKNEATQANPILKDLIFSAIIFKFTSFVHVMAKHF